MKAVKIIAYIALFLFTVCCCTSCKETVREEVQIVVQNRTESAIQATLYPKAAYLSGSLYRASDEGGEHQSTKRSLPPNSNGHYEWDEVIFTSGDLAISPHSLALKVFDSIYFSIENESRVIKFTHEAAVGYSENIFSATSTWDYEVREWNQQTQLRKNPVKHHCYTFLISKDKMVVE